MRTLDEAEIGRLIREGRVSLDDLEPEDTPEPEDTMLKDGIASIVSAIKGIEMPKIEKPDAPKITVNVPKREWRNLTMTVTDRDKNGYIKTVAIQETT